MTFGSQAAPRLWDKVTGVDRFSKPVARRDDHLSRTTIQPCAPPTEGAVGNDVVLAQAHQVHVVVSLVIVVDVVRVGGQG